MATEAAHPDVLAECGCLYQVTGLNPFSFVSKIRCQAAELLLTPRQYAEHLGLDTHQGRRQGTHQRPRVAPPCARKHQPNLPAWTPFHQTVTGRKWGGRTLEQAIAEVSANTGLPEEEVRRQLEGHAEYTAEEEVWVNSRYQVNLRRIPCRDGSLPTLVHLSIKRLDKQCPGEERFRDFQRIKNELVGPECEGVELYPAETRLVDTSNQFHVWCFDDPAFRLPFGMESRLVNRATAMAGAVQRPFEEDGRDG